MFSLALRDIIWFASLLVSITLAYGKLKSELRHLDDIKSDKKELQSLSQEIRQTLSEIQTTVARIEVVIKNLEKEG